MLGGAECQRKALLLLAAFVDCRLIFIQEGLPYSGGTVEGMPLVMITKFIQH